ncbi:hypothetical protein PHISP_02067 [Aspergillus sp. HF37]|nr:hypothetical protein PHISP_02067 [Aspergillus sp. HF37]
MATSDPQNNLTSSPETTAISALKSLHPTLWYRIHVLLFDLQHYAGRADSRTRLETVTDPTYLGLPYFSPNEAETLRTADSGGKPLSQVLQTRLDERLGRRMEKRAESGDFRVCAAYDLAPVLGEVLGIEIKRLAKEKGFVELVDRKGLELGDGQWGGLAQKSYAPKGRKKR